MTVPRYVLALAHAAESAVGDVGGKARGIGRLMAAGARVPAGFCVRSSALRDFVARWQSDGHLTAAGSTAQARPDTLTSLREAYVSAPLPLGMELQVTRALADVVPADDTEVWVMVRSSALMEDVSDARAPGVYESVRAAARLADVLFAIRTVWASALSENAVRYRAHLGHSAVGADMAVVVQMYVEARLGGAIYTIDPVSQNPTKVVVSWVDSHPKALLAGEEAGFAAAFDKSAAVTPPGRWPAAVESAVTEARRLERLLNEPLDLEFVVDAQDVLHFVQCRPLPYTPGWRCQAIPVGPAHEENTLHSPKIVAVNLNRLAGGDLTGQIVIRPPLFEAFKQTGSLSAEMRAVLVDALGPLLRRGDVALRSAYWSALNSADNMPQSGHLRTPDECLDHLRALWTYVIDQRLDDYSAEVAVLGGNWLQTSASALVAADPASRQVHVDAVPGYPEGLESLAYQTSTVDLDTGRVVARRMPKGGLTALSPHDETPTEVRASPDTPALTDQECVRAARVGYNLAQKLEAPVRVEFLIVQRDGHRAVVVWQVERLSTGAPVATYRLAGGAVPDSRAVASGTATRVTSLDEFATLDAADSATRILLLDITAMRARDRAQQALIAEHAARLSCPVVVRSSPLSHFSAILRDYGAVVYAVREILPDLVSGTAVTVVPDN